MADKYKYTTSQLLNFAPGSYLERTSRPIYAIIFLLPFIVFYELGTMFINTDVLNQSQIRVVAFVWLQNLLEYLGFGSRFAWAAPALAVVVILLALQVTSHKRWAFCLADVLPMAIECILLAIPLIVLSLFLNSAVGPQNNLGQSVSNSMQTQSKIVLSCSSATQNTSPSNTQNTTSEAGGDSLLANIITGIGAGIYEELIFRLILICALMMLFQDVLRLSHKSSVILSVLVSAALFSAHHHIFFLNGQLTTGAPFDWKEFGFRTIAGVYFAILFAIRGFAITAGTHAFYDIIATAINLAFFQQ